MVTDVSHVTKDGQEDPQPHFRYYMCPALTEPNAPHYRPRTCSETGPTLCCSVDVSIDILHVAYLRSLADWRNAISDAVSVSFDKKMVF